VTETAPYVRCVSIRGFTRVVAYDQRIYLSMNTITNAAPLICKIILVKGAIAHAAPVSVKGVRCGLYERQMHL